MTGVWATRAAALRHRIDQLIAEDGAWSASDFAAELDGLESQLVDIDAYRRAVNAGRKTMPGVHRDDNDPVVGKWTDHVMEYAVDVPGRIAQQLADAANAAEAIDGATVHDIVAALHAKIDALESSVTRYAGPLWGAGQEGYGRQLDAHNVLLKWMLDPGAHHCEDCPAAAEATPCTADELPIWPGEGECGDHCRCAIIADKDTWNDAFPEAA